MHRFDSSLGMVELTDERERHIVEFHPEVKAFRKHFSATLNASASVRTSKFDKEVKIFYQLLPSNNKYLAIVVETNRRNFILTAYLTHKIQHHL